MKKMDMTHGSIGNKTLSFALFLAVTGFLQQIFNVIDTVIMGQFVGKEAMAAVGSNGPVIGFLVTLFFGIALGSNVVISQFTGQRNKEGIERAVHTAILFAAVSGVFLVAFAELSAETILSLLQVPADLMSMSLEYMRIFFFALPGILMYDFTSAIFRSQGDTRTPLVCLAISGVLKVIISYSLVVWAGQGVAAVAISSAFSQLLSAAMLLYFLAHSHSAIHLSLRKLSIDFKILKEILRIGSPAGMQGSVFCLSNIIIQTAINSLGADVMAASTAAFNLEIMVYILINSFGQTCTTFVGQNYGAGDMARCRRVGLITGLQNLAVTILISIPLYVFGVPLLEIFNSDPAVVAFGMIRMAYIVLAEPLNLLIEMISGYLRGFGHSLTPALIVVVGICGTRILYVMTVFPLSPDFSCLMAVYPLSWLITVIGMVILLFAKRKKYIWGEQGPGKLEVRS